MRSVSRPSVRSWRCGSKSTAGECPVAIVSENEVTVTAGFLLLKLMCIRNSSEKAQSSICFDGYGMVSS